MLGASGPWFTPLPPSPCVTGLEAWTKLQQQKEDAKVEEVVPVKRKGWGRALNEMDKFRVRTLPFPSLRPFLGLLHDVNTGGAPTGEAAANLPAARHNRRHGGSGRGKNQSGRPEQD